MKKRILILADELPPESGGAGKMAELMISTLAERDHSVTVLSRKIKGSVKVEHATYHYVSYAEGLHLYVPAYGNKLRSIKPEQFDRIIVNDCRASTVAAMYLSREIAGKCIPFLHGSEPEAFYHHNSSFNRLFSVKEKYIRLLSGSKRVIAVSNYMKEKFLQVSGEQEIGRKIQVLYNCFSEKQFFPVSSPERAVDRKIQHIFSAGRIVREKGYDRMYRIFRDLLSEGYPFRWTIAGDGPYRETLVKLATGDGIADRIEFAGYCTSDVLRKYYNDSDVFWTLSDFNEAFPLVNIEANACGTPAIAWNRGGTSESIADGISGFIVGSEEECKDLLRLRKYRELDRESILEHARKFTLTEYGRNLEQLLD